jgi:hypothetical protein
MAPSSSSASAPKGSSALTTCQTGSRELSYPSSSIELTTESATRPEGVRLAHVPDRPAARPAQVRRPGGRHGDGRAGLAGRGQPATLTSAEQAECLRALERAASVHTAARAKVLAAFCAGGGYEDDGQGSAKTWLKWQTRITPGAAAGAMGWMRRLSAHPAVWIALADAAVSESWARQICVWSDLLPERHRADADEILLGAARGGAELADLGGLADEMRRRLAPADRDDDGFDDRQVRLELTFGGAGEAGRGPDPALRGGAGGGAGGFG